MYRQQKINKQQTLKRQFAGVALVSVLGFASWVLIDQARHSGDRNRFVAATVRDSIQLLAQDLGSSSSISTALRQSGWPDDFLALQSWLIREGLTGTPPDEIGRSLAQLRSGRRFSPVFETSLRRWGLFLESWNQASASWPVRPGASMLAEGRMAYHQAEGYSRQGKSYDATPLYVWSILSLVRFVESDSASDSVPEAVFLMGEAFVRLRRAFPSSARIDRILNLCADQYPDSVWASLSRSSWFKLGGLQVVAVEGEASR